MAQQVCRFRILLPMQEAQEDIASIDFVYEATGSNPNLTLSDCYTSIENFFLVKLGAMSQTLGYYLSGQLDQSANAVTIQTYDVTAALNGEPAGSPIDTHQFTMLSGSGGGALPPQLALCVAYRADYGTAIEHGPTTDLPSDDDAIDQGAPATHPGRTRPRGRMRGRFYFGPLDQQACGTLSGGGPPIVGNASTDLRADMGIAFNELASTQNSGLASQRNLVQWSRRSAAVNAIRWYYVNEGLATTRRRQDTTQARVHTWVAV